MFKFRGQRKDNGKWVVGYYVVWYEIDEDVHTIRADDGRYYKVHPSSLSIGFSKLDSTRAEIFASFEIDGVMTTGGDVVELKHIQGKQFKVQYSAIGCEFIMQRPDSDIVWNVSNAGQFEITIIGKGGGNDK